MTANGKVFIDTYGCTANQNDSQIMMGLLKNAGFKIVSFDNAEYVIVNSCGVKSSTEEKIIHKLGKLSTTDKKVIVAGCLTKINPDRIKKTIPNFSAMLDSRSVDKIVDVMSEIEKGKNGVIVFSKLPPDKSILPKFSPNTVIDILQISEGCLSNCVFCGTKLARGNLVSHRPENIREAIRQSVKNGFKEIQITSQDMSAYGRDIGTNLPELLESITRIEGKFFVRVGMMNPLHFKKFEIKNLIEVYKNEKIFKFLHLCVQSGSNKVLKIMRRGYTVEDFIFYVEKFREEIPEITLMTDVITGHPGESEKDHEQTIQLIKNIKPDLVNLSKFGLRPGTAAEKMEQVPKEVINRRCKELSKVIEHVSKERNKKWLHWKGEAIVDEINDGFVTARNYAYKPIIIRKNLPLGEFVTLSIKDVRSNFLIGEIYN